MLFRSTNIDLVSAFALGKAGDTSNGNLDASWMIAFVKQADEYLVRVRTMEYVFGSLEQNRFYFDVSQKSYDSKTGKTIKDQIKVLGINPDSELITPLRQDIIFEISDSIKFDDGYQSTNEINLGVEVLSSNRHHKRISLHLTFSKLGFQNLSSAPCC